ncbi:hypothetical protein SIID45300_01752 [Candidatus Magnetaquicoccaceae bacterium FCR-1]|uniref:Phage virion morphogenesis protein n=1 Tax=Candidatus Magnetaquiglobus chichijimensis TaxID=3141448 RepID=A0ABQ0C958_9PROT
MGGVKLTVERQSFPALMTALNRLEARTKDLTPAFKSMGQHLLRTIDQRFDEQKSPHGQPWQDISEFTKEKKRGTFGQDKILTDTGRMRRSITYIASSERLEIGTNVVYAKKHQFGGKTDIRGHFFILAARPFLGLSTEEREAITRIVLEYLAKAVSGRSGSPS